MINSEITAQLAAGDKVRMMFDDDEWLNYRQKWHVYVPQYVAIAFNITQGDAAAATPSRESNLAGRLHSVSAKPKEKCVK